MSSNGVGIPGLGGAAPFQQSSTPGAFVGPYADLSTVGQDQLLLSAQQGGSSSKGGIGNFFKGIFTGAVNSVTSLLSPTGLALALGSAGLLLATGGAALPLLIGAGVIAGGTQVATGLMSGDAEKAGQGVFGIGASILGVKLAPKTVQSKGNGQTYAYVAKDGAMQGTFGRLMSTLNPFSKMKQVAKTDSGVYTAVQDGASASTLRLSASNIKHGIQGIGKKKPGSTVDGDTPSPKPDGAAVTGEAPTGILGKVKATFSKLTASGKNGKAETGQMAGLINSAGMGSTSSGMVTPPPGIYEQ